MNKNIRYISVLLLIIMLFTNIMGIVANAQEQDQYAYYVIVKKGDEFYRVPEQQYRNEVLRNDLFSRRLVKGDLYPYITTNRGINVYGFILTNKGNDDPTKDRYVKLMDYHVTKLESTKSDHIEYLKETKQIDYEKEFKGNLYDVRIENTVNGKEFIKEKVFGRETIEDIQKQLNDALKLILDSYPLNEGMKIENDNSFFVEQQIQAVMPNDIQVLVRKDDQTYTATLMKKEQEVEKTGITVIEYDETARLLANTKNLVSYEKDKSFYVQTDSKNQVKHVVGLDNIRVIVIPTGVLKIGEKQLNAIDTKNIRTQITIQRLEHGLNLIDKAFKVDDIDIDNSSELISNVQKTLKTEGLEDISVSVESTDKKEEYKLILNLKGKNLDKIIFVSEKEKEVIDNNNLDKELKKFNGNIYEVNDLTKDNSKELEEIIKSLVSKGIEVSISKTNDTEYKVNITDGKLNESGKVYVILKDNPLKPGTLKPGENNKGEIGDNEITIETDDDNNIKNILDKENKPVIDVPTNKDEITINGETPTDEEFEKIVEKIRNQRLEIAMSKINKTYKVDNLTQDNSVKIKEEVEKDLAANQFKDIKAEVSKTNDEEYKLELSLDKEKLLGKIKATTDENVATQDNDLNKEVDKFNGQTYEVNDLTKDNSELVKAEVKALISSGIEIDVEKTNDTEYKVKLTKGDIKAEGRVYLSEKAGKPIEKDEDEEDEDLKEFKVKIEELKFEKVESFSEKDITTIKNKIEEIKTSKENYNTITVEVNKDKDKTNKYDVVLSKEGKKDVETKVTIFRKLYGEKVEILAGKEKLTIIMNSDEKVFEVEDENEDMLLEKLDNIGNGEFDDGDVKLIEDRIDLQSKLTLKNIGIKRIDDKISGEENKEVYIIQGDGVAGTGSITLKFEFVELFKEYMYLENLEDINEYDGKIDMFSFDTKNNERVINNLFEFKTSENPKLLLMQIGQIEFYIMDYIEANPEKVYFRYTKDKK